MGRPARTFLTIQKIIEPSHGRPMGVLGVFELTKIAVERPTEEVNFT